MDEKLREILREHIYRYYDDEFYQGDSVAYCSCGAKFQVAPFYEQWLNHIAEQLERVQPATPEFDPEPYCDLCKEVVCDEQGSACHCACHAGEKHPFAA